MFSPAFFPSVARLSDGLGSRVMNTQRPHGSASPAQRCAAPASTCPGLAAVTRQELLPTTTEHPARSHLPVYELPESRWQPGTPGNVHYEALHPGVHIKNPLPPPTLFSFNTTLQVRLCFSFPSCVIVQSFTPRNISKFSFKKKHNRSLKSLLW